MQKNSQTRGIALGAVLALFSSLFLGVVPAQATTATDGQYIAVTPKEGPVSNFNGTILEDFPIHAYLLPGITNSNFAAEKVRYEVTRVSGAVDIIVDTTSATAIAADATAGSVSAAAGGSQNQLISSVSSYAAIVRADQTTASKVTVAALDSGAATLNIRAISTSATLASLSAITAVVDVKVWVENTATNNNIHDALEWFTTKRITLHALSAVPVTGAISQMDSGDKQITASGTVGALNFENMTSQYKLLLRSSTTTFLGDPNGSVGVAMTESAQISQDLVTSRSGVVSASFAVSASDGVDAADSLSGRVIYIVDSAEYALGTTFSMVVTNPGVTQLYADVVAGDNATQSGTTATVRTNTISTFKIGAVTGAVSVSKAISIRFTDTDADLSTSVKEIKFDGGTATTSFPTSASPLTVTTGADGFATFTVETLGFVGGETFGFTAYVGNISKSLTVEVEAATHSITPVYSTYQSGAGETTAVSWTVKDQWLVSTPRSDFRVKVTKGGDTGFSYTQTVSYVPVVAGVATLDFVPQPAAKTGSATVDATLQMLNVNTGGYVETGKSATQVSVNVSATANAFGTGLAASRSVSVSYFPSTLSWVAVSGKVTNTGSAVVVSGTGLVFRDATGATYSDGVTVRAGSGPSYTFDVAGTTAGNFTITLTNGSATTTSLVIVDAAAHSAGSAITFDTSTITAGKTKIIVGKVTDANGNPVDTTAGEGTASIVVTYAGTAGIPVGTMPTETDANGEFRVSVLTSAADSGAFTLTAVYLKDGASTAAAQKLTKVQTVTVGASAESSADQKVNAGSFKGYVAVYAKGYEGQRLSAKIGNDWVVVESLESNFERVVDFTGAGYTIAVRIYIDRVLVDTITVTTK